MSDRFHLKQLTDDRVFFIGACAIAVYLVVAAGFALVFFTRPAPFKPDRSEKLCAAYRFWEFKSQQQVWQMDNLCKEQGL